MTNKEDIIKEIDDTLGESDDKELLGSVIEKIKAKAEGENLTKVLDLVERMDKNYKELSEAVKAIKVEIPDTFEVTVLNPSEEVKVSNLKDIKIPEPKNSISIENIKEFPNYKDDLSSIVEINGLIARILTDKELKVDLDRYTDPKRPLAVRLSGGKKFYDAISYAVAAGSTAAYEDAGGIERSGLVDASGHVQVDVLSGGSGGTLVVDNEAVNVADTGQLVLGTDGANYQILKTDSDGNLQIDVLSVPTVTVQAVNLDIRDLTSTDVVTVTGGAGQTADVKITLDSEVVPVTGTFWQATQPVSLASVPSHAVTNAGVFAVQIDGDALTSLQLIDDTVYIDDADWTDNTSKHLLVGGLYQSSPQTVTDGDVAPFLIDVNGRLVVALSATDNTVLDNIDTDLTTIIGHVDGIEGLLTTIDADTSSLAGAVAGTEMQVDVVGALPAGTNAIGKLAANSGVDIGDVDILSVIAGTGATNLGKAEDAVHGSGDTGVMVLAVRDDDPIGVLSGTAGDYEPLHTDGRGALWVHPFPTDVDLANAGTTHVKKYYTNAGAVTDGIVWSPAAGKRWYVTDLIINISAAATVTLEDDLAAGDSAVMKFELAANSGVSHSFSTPLFSGEDAADLVVTTSAGNIYITICGYEI